MWFPKLDDFFLGGGGEGGGGWWVWVGVVVGECGPSNEEMRFLSGPTLGSSYLGKLPGISQQISLKSKP